MAGSVLRRVIEGVIVILLVTFTTFMLTALLPGSEAAVICSVSATPACLAKESAFLGLNHPLIWQYLIWLGRFFTGNFGISYTTGGTEPITRIVATSYSTTLELIVYSQIIALVISVPLAMWAALRPNSLFDRISSTVSFGALSLPPFIVGPLLALLFTAELHVFPNCGHWVMIEQKAAWESVVLAFLSRKDER